MTASHYLLTRFGKLSLFRQTCVVVLAAIIGADTLTLVFYSIFFADRLLLDLFLTTVITVAVGFPLGYFFLRQQLKLALMAAKLDRAARIDHLTSLANRKTFFEEAEAIVGSEAFKEGAVLFIDADHFKSINDTFGPCALLGHRFTVGVSPLPDRQGSTLCGISFGPGRIHARDPYRPFSRTTSKVRIGGDEPSFTSAS